MTSYKLPETSAVPSLPTDQVVAILDHLFEPCASLHTLSADLLEKETFASYDNLVDGIHGQLQTLAESPSHQDAQMLESILSAHPRLGEKKIDSAQSQGEQAQLAATKGEEEDKLERKNAAYEDTFPGLRYVVFVNGRDRATILDDMQARIDRKDVHIERVEAIKVSPRCNVCNIIFLANVY